MSVTTLPTDGFGLDGWKAESRTWTYSSATAFTVGGDMTSTYSVGDKIKLTQTTVKYFYIVGLSFSTGTTTVTITGGTDYTLANAAITSPHFSKLHRPVGFPVTFNYQPTFTGFTATVPTGIHRFSVVDGLCHVLCRHAVDGTSNATTFTMTLPVNARNDSVWVGIAGVTNNSGTLTANGVVTINGATSQTTMNVLRDYGGTAFLNSGGKKANALHITYEIATS